MIILATAAGYIQAFSNSIKAIASVRLAGRAGCCPGEYHRGPAGRPTRSQISVLFDMRVMRWSDADDAAQLAASRSEPEAFMAFYRRY